MIYLVLPRGRNYGWGLCGKHLVKEMSQLSAVKWVTEAFARDDIGDDLEYHFLKQFLIDPVEARNIASGTLKILPHPLLLAICDHHLTPWLVALRGTFTCGYTFFERDKLSHDCIRNGREHFDLIITGSTWCEQVLRSHGLSAVETVIQGIDPQVFNPGHSEKAYFRDRFVVFSGGKFELRKGQDIVIRAYKVLQDRHADVMLVNAWHNHWPQSMATMRASSLIRIGAPGGDYEKYIGGALADNGIDLNRVITLPALTNSQLAKIYKNTDVGLFPNRCEGGTNLVLMEYMACGKPVIVSYNSGHKDIVGSHNALLIRNMKPLVIGDPEMNYSWDDPDLDETVELLEWAYQHREELHKTGEIAGQDMANHTWKEMGRNFFRLIPAVTGASRTYSADDH